MARGLLDRLNWLLVIDSFFVLASFVWFVLALLGRSLDIPLGFDLWLRLWDPVFTPALGLLMAGAILSGLFSYVQKRWFLN
ncbi:hypothetical protein L3556_04510 [Candidatus Synechococcus calcipolaris G9]|uniref:Uncharacterized protein n=1 Tax=Candidatus Synechococcus calcipolaris G9 TaxID=1497997 RepID=A0ABT6EY87_9SYNE|nr:hypothetical protein [Candidatus Synechococcus calcipolaris]MDG2990201.1 hypothetical protein [Candidatus Synechococcus calcipolaris G9]